MLSPRYLSVLYNNILKKNIIYGYYVCVRTVVICVLIYLFFLHFTMYFSISMHGILIYFIGCFAKNLLKTVFFSKMLKYEIFTISP